MRPEHVSREALFNEVKGSLFEYLVARLLAVRGGEELKFQASIDPNYLGVLSQQDRMIRQFYPEMLPFLTEVSSATSEAIIAHLGVVPRQLRLMGKFSNSPLKNELHEADLLATLGEETLPISLKLNKRNAFVNTKSAGIRSFFAQYFGFLPAAAQERYDQIVDLEFNRMAHELHHLAGLDYNGDFKGWVRAGFSELPGELDEGGREILKAYYARLARRMHGILEEAAASDPGAFRRSLLPLLGFSSPRILQVVCFHDFRAQTPPVVEIHRFEDVEELLRHSTVKGFHGTASVDIDLGSCDLQVRIKPMNKFTTTAIKVNCATRFRPPSTS